MTREQRIVKMFDSLNDMDADRRARLVELAEAAMAHRQLTVEQARLHIVAISDPTKENVARHLDYAEDTVKPSKEALNQLAYNLLKTGLAEDIDAFRADLADQFGELREEVGAVIDDIAERVKTSTATVRGAVRSRVATIVGERVTKN